MSDAACVACGGALSLFGWRAGYPYFRCASCGTLQLAPLPSKDELAQAYASTYASAAHIDADPEACRRLSRTYYRALLKVLKKRKVAGRVAEVGSGWGGLCTLLIAKGFQCEGVEPSEKMAAYCQAQGLPVRQGDIALLPQDTYAALVLASVFEHLVDHDAWLAQARARLKSGGLIVSAQPTARFLTFMAQVLRLGSLRLPLPQLHQGFCPPWHTVLFSIEGMRRIAERNGFDLIEVRRYPQGRAQGLTGIVQRLLDAANCVGWLAMRERWPLVIGHIFVLKKTSP